MNASMIALFQVLVSLILSLQNSPKTTPAMVQAVAAITKQAVQISNQVQAMGTGTAVMAPGVTPTTTSTASLVTTASAPTGTIWTSITQLRNASYLDANGKLTPLGTGVALVESDTSFGDLNNDGYDDAAVIVQSTDSQGNTTFELAAMINQKNGTVANVADISLGKNVQVFSHHVESAGVIVLNAQIGNQPAATTTYQLVGNQLMKN